MENKNNESGKVPPCIYSGLNIKKESADIIVGALAIILFAFIMIAVFTA